MSAAVRIYVLHHAESKPARAMVDRIYDWFRLPEQRHRGIPVYVRTDPSKKAWKEALEKDNGWDEASNCLIYLLPLVDELMVREPAWHDHLQRLAGLSNRCGETARAGWVMMPVAMHHTAFNLPEEVAGRNFIRLPEAGSPEDAAAQEKAVEQMLADLTEAMARDLNGRIFPRQRGQPLKIFISYARADKPDVPRQIRNFILGNTQCSAFLDENDIGFGFKFKSVLESATKHQARAFIVVAGDHYADRPICRWEISQFIQPDELPISGKKGGRQINVFHPMMMVSTLGSNRPTRVLPELGGVPCIQWHPGRERLCFSLLMRDLLMSLRNVQEARNLHQAGKLPDGLVVNRMPGPMILQKLLNGLRTARSKVGHIFYPGNGLPQMELRVLRQFLPGKLGLSSFLEIKNQPPQPLKNHLNAGRPSLHGRIIALSYAESENLAELGYLQQHLHEAFIYLLRPLVRLGADVMYGGWPPKPGQSSAQNVANMALSILNLYVDEVADADDTAGKQRRPRGLPRTFHPASWPACDSISMADEAAWINHSSFLRVRPTAEELAKAPPGTNAHLALRAVIPSRVRKKMAKGYLCDVPGRPRRKVIPAVVVMVGGKTKNFQGIMPGVIEEFACHFKAKRPIYLLGGFGGAGGVLARHLLAAAGEATQLDLKFLKEGRKDYMDLVNGCKALGLPAEEHPDARIEAVLGLIEKARATPLDKVMDNGLDSAENVKLLTTRDTSEAVHLVWTGMGRRLLEPMTPAKATPV